ARGGAGGSRVARAADRADRPGGPRPRGPPRRREDVDVTDVVVLLIDDQPIIAEAVRRMLAGEKGLTFHYCRDPLAAVAAAERVKPTVILQDLVMPGVDGLTLARTLRENAATRDVPLIVLSTKEEPAVKEEAFAVGANDYLVK